MLRTWILCIVLLLLCQSCAIAPKKEVHYIPGEARLFTPEIRKEIFPEFEYLDAEKLKFGIALSGGGVRSASFSIGALSGLDEAGILKQIDVISSVSGGGYAAYWFMNSLLNFEKPLEQFTKPGESNFSIKDLFADCYHMEMDFYRDYKNQPPKYPVCNDSKDNKNDNSYRFQYNLAQRSDLIYYSMDDFWQYLELAGKLSAQVPSIVAHHLSNSAFDWSFNSSALRKYYQNGIERTYGLIPKNIQPASYNKRTYYNAASSMFLTNAKTKELSFDDLRNYTIERWKQCSATAHDAGECSRPPLWIINTTAGVANRVYEWMEPKQPLSRTVFSITPFSYGSGEYGYVNEAFPPDQMSVPKAVSISGAAVDAQSKGSNGKGNPVLAAAGHLLDINLGYSIDNYNKFRSNIAFHRLLPWPLYYLHGFTRNKDSVDIYLSDGGHSENLGAYPLIIRGVSNIIVIDAEHDSKGEFESLIKLKKALCDEGLLLSFNTATNNQSAPDFIKMLNGGKDNQQFDPHNTSRSVFHFKVTGFHPGYISDNLDENFVNIIYVKSSLNADPQHMNATVCNISNEAYPCTVVAYYIQNNLKLDKTPKEGENLFPQHLTFAGEAKSSPMYYYAYRDLAAYITKKLQVIDGKLVYPE